MGILAGGIAPFVPGVLNMTAGDSLPLPFATLEPRVMEALRDELDPAASAHSPEATIPASVTRSPVTSSTIGS